MRGSKTDALRGIASRQSSCSAPYDRMVMDNYTKRPMAYVAQIDNPAYDIHTRREIGVQANVFPQFPTIDPQSYKPAVMQNNGVAIIPNAGIFRKSSSYVLIKQ